MKEYMKQALAVFLVLSVMISVIIPIDAEAATVPKLEKESVSVDAGKSVSMKIIPGGWKITKVTAKPKKKSIVKLSCTKKKVIVRALNAGKTQITVSVKAKKSGKHKAFKLKAMVTVKRSETLTIAKFTQMISDVVKKCDPELESQWKTLATKALNDTQTIKTDTAALILYEAACLLNMGARPTAYWGPFHAAYENERGNNFAYSPREDLFDNCQNTCPFEHLFQKNPGWDYLTGAMLFAMGRSSAVDPSPYFECVALSAEGFDKTVTTDEGEKAAERLLAAYNSEHEGSFDIRDYETDWSDARLKAAYDEKDKILNSKTQIVKSDTFIQGETYTGTAYYVSNNGNDSNDGMSPDTPWSTLNKVTNTPMKSGDIVFFERGGRWFGRLKMQEGVTYSAYGEGSKPIWTGSPTGIADSTCWESYGETEDGGKLWRYVDRTEEVGIILLDGTTVARKYYPLWDGKNHLTDDGKSVLDLKKVLYVDGMYCVVMDLSGLSDFSSMIRVTDRKGDLIMRCDRGNPGTVYSSIELGMGGDQITTADGGRNTIDNICYRCFPGGGMDANGHDNIIFQNCESCWCGGGAQYYSYENGTYMTGSSGGGLLLFGKHLIGRNNYIHDCESKGIAVVINGNGHSSLERKDILAENNVVERCGNSVYMMTEFVPAGKTTVFEDIHLRNNYLIHSGKGWRAHNQQWLNGYRGSYGSDCEGIKVNNIRRTGEVSFEGNLIYKALGSSVLLCTNNETTTDPYPTFKGNTFVSENYGLFFTEEGKDGDNKAVLFSPSEEEMKKRLAEYLKEIS